MKQAVLFKLTSVLVNVVVSLALGGVLLARQDWFGAGDTGALLAWTLPLAAVVAVAGPAVVSVERRWPGVGRTGLLVAATVLLVLGWLLVVWSLLGPWMGAFSFPIVYLWLVGVGAQLLFLQRQLPAALGSRFSWRYWLASGAVLLGTLIGMAGLLFLAAYLDHPVPETYLIPRAFKGKFRVVYGEPGGVSPALENGRRVLKLPASGILIIQPKFKAGIIDNEYYLVDVVGHRQKLTGEVRYPVQLGVELLGTGVMGGAMPDGSSSSKSPLAITYNEFEVFNHQSVALSETRQMRQQQRIDSLTTALVQYCRASYQAQVK